jgi:hypothetical protein
MRAFAENSATAESNYEVGYRKPPKRTQFSKGVSGNRAGRPPGSGAARKSLKEILLEKMPVRKGDRIVNLPIYEVLITNLVNLAMNGNSTLGLKLFQLVPYEEIRRQMPGQYKITKDMDAHEAMEVYMRMIRET